jgi:hypothetical protein
MRAANEMIQEVLGDRTSGGGKDGRQPRAHERAIVRMGRGARYQQSHGRPIPLAFFL